MKIRELFCSIMPDDARGGPGEHAKAVVSTADGLLLYDHPEIRIADLAGRDYHFDDISPGDVVVDIGAHIGGFCIRAARRSRFVTAVEPVLAPMLRQNISLNNADIRIIEGGLGNGAPLEIRWGAESRICRTFSIREIVDAAGGCDFLKCDCEGAEWTIDPEDLDGVRRIEMELHVPPISDRVNPSLLEYLGTNFRFTIDRAIVHQPLGVMGVLHAERREDR